MHQVNIRASPSGPRERNRHLSPSFFAQFPNRTLRGVRIRRCWVMSKLSLSRTSRQKRVLVSLTVTMSSCHCVFSWKLYVKEVQAETHIVISHFTRARARRPQAGAPVNATPVLPTPPPPPKPPEVLGRSVAKKHEGEAQCFREIWTLV